MASRLGREVARYAILAEKSEAMETEDFKRLSELGLLDKIIAETKPETLLTKKIIQQVELENALIFAEKRFYERQARKDLRIYEKIMAREELKRFKEDGGWDKENFWADEVYFEYCYRTAKYACGLGYYGKRSNNFFNVCSPVELSDS